MNKTARILYCDCSHSRILPEAVKGEVLKALRESGTAYEAVPDLCGAAARKDPRLLSLVRSGPVRIAACYPRAVQWLLHRAGLDYVSCPSGRVPGARLAAAHAALKRG